MPIDEGIKVNGTVIVSSALTGESSEISMFVVDDANYQKWAAHGSPTYVFQKDISSGQSYSFTAVRSGVYHFIFDNTDSPVKKNVILSADLQKQFTVNVPDERVTYVGFGILAIGCLVTLVGVTRRTQVPWA